MTRVRIPNATRIILPLAGVTLVAVGLAAFVAPQAFYASTGIDLGPKAALLNELRAASGAVLFTGLIVTLGAVKASLTRTAAVAGAAVHLGYASGRLLSWAVDGPPGGALVLAAAVSSRIPPFGVFRAWQTMLF